MLKGEKNMKNSEYLLFRASCLVALCSEGSAEYLSNSHSRAVEKEGIDLKLLSE